MNRAISETLFYVNFYFHIDMGDIPSKSFMTFSLIQNIICDHDKFTVCQKTDPHCDTMTTENGRACLIEATCIMKDIVNDRPKLVNQKISYHVSNE